METSLPVIFPGVVSTLYPPPVAPESASSRAEATAVTTKKGARMEDMEAAVTEATKAAKAAGEAREAREAKGIRLAEAERAVTMTIKTIVRVINARTTVRAVTVSNMAKTAIRMMERMVVKGRMATDRTAK